MRTAIFADLHDNVTALTTVLADAETHKVDRLVFLGDAGHKPRLLAALQVRGIPCVYGNWEVSGLRRLPAALAEWVGAWPPLLRQGDVVYCHASPEMPASLPTTAAAAEWIKPGMSWSALFPRLHQNSDALWNALAWMESHDISVLFHGHTHVQTVWIWEPTTNRLRALSNPALVRLLPGVRAVVGVGSAGAPEDGAWPRYAIHDDTAQTVLLRSVRND